jgi:DNA-binding NarL/FixJ family response regulator
VTDDAGTVRVVVVDDQPTIRLGMTMILEHEPDMVVVGEAADGAGAVDVVLRTRPDVVLMDVRMPEVDGVEATRRIRADDRGEGSRVVVLTTFDDQEYVEGALHAGADAFLLKDADPATLVDTVRRVHAGESVLDPKVTRHVVTSWRTLAEPRPATSVPHAAVASLIPRERQVLVEVAGGGSNREVGAALGLTEATAKAYVHTLLTRLGCTSRAGLVAVAYEAGVVVPQAARPPSGPPGAA